MPHIWGNQEQYLSAPLRLLQETQAHQRAWKLRQFSPPAQRRTIAITGLKIPPFSCPSIHAEIEIISYGIDLKALIRRPLWVGSRLSQLDESPNGYLSPAPLRYAVTTSSRAPIRFR